MPTLMERFVEDLGRVSDLPSKPQVLMQLVSALSRPDVSLRDVAEIIRRDPALAAQVLRIANSAIYAPRLRIFSVTDALMRIGLIQTRRLSLALSLYNMVPRPEFFAQQQAFWHHSLGTAHAAAVLCRRVGPACGLDEEQLFLLGLFHDVGLVALAGYYPKEHGAVKEFAARSELPYYAAEVSVLGTDHGDLGAVMGTYWGLPTVAVELIRTHHSLDRVPPELRPALQVLQVAEWLCVSAGIGDLGEGWSPGVDAVLLEDLGILPDSVNDLIWEARGETERTESALACGR